MREMIHRIMNENKTLNNVTSNRTLPDNHRDIKVSSGPSVRFAWTRSETCNQSPELWNCNYITYFKKSSLLVDSNLVFPIPLHENCNCASSFSDFI